MQQLIHNKNRLPFIIIETILLICYLLSDLFFPECVLFSSIVKYSSIILCFLFTLQTTLLIREKKTFVCLCAIFMTLVADFFLLFTPYYFWGVLCFLVVQTLYYYYCEQHTARFLLFTFMFRILLRFIASLILTLILMVIGLNVNFLIFVTLFYILSFIDNLLILSKNHNTSLFFWGMLLFFACDLSVGLYNLPDFIHLSAPSTQTLHQLFGILMWAFYLPGQVLMAIGIRQDSLTQ